MKDIQHILERIAHLEAVRSPYALATVVDVAGSTYRGLGARMLVESPEQSEGTIGGGCLESDVREQAAAAIEDGQPRLIQYDATLEDDIVLGTGLGCRGVTRVLIEPISTGHRPLAVDSLRASALESTHVVLATVFESEGIPGLMPGQRLAMGHEKPMHCDIADELMRTWVADEARVFWATREEKRHLTARTLRYDRGRGWASVLIETLRPPLHVWIFGAGYDARPIVSLASSMGWRASVVDHRPSFALPERFPDAHQVVLVSPHQWPDDLAIEPNSAAIVMTHSFLHDQFVLRHILPIGLDYIGILGPYQRTQRLLGDLDERPVSAPFAPVGLDLGAETPEEIALSIVAEIQATRSGRGGGHLSFRSGPIHNC